MRHATTMFIIKEKIHTIFYPTPEGSAIARIINGFIIGLILLNVAAVILETVDPLYNSYKPLFRNFELFSVCIFTVEYLLRLWTCTLLPGFQNPVKGRIRYMLRPGSLIDLFAILPSFLPMVTKLDLRFIRILRLVRFFRFFKLGRYTQASGFIIKVFREKKAELIMSFVMTIFLIVVASSIMYFVEHDAQPGKFSSIPETMWWSVATLTTVGYGDLYPITTLGKTLTACISILGIGLFALPAGILASGFSDAFKKPKAGTVCPHCGTEVH